MEGIVRIGPFEEVHAIGIVALNQSEGWPTFSDAERVRTLFTAPGVVGLTAVSGSDGTVVGAAHVLTDGYHAYLNSLLVAADRRGRGIGRQLVSAAFTATGAVRMDLLASPGSETFYAKLPTRTMSGFRIYPPN